MKLAFGKKQAGVLEFMGLTGLKNCDADLKLQEIHHSKIKMVWATYSFLEQRPDFFNEGKFDWFCIKKENFLHKKSLFK